MLAIVYLMLSTNLKDFIKNYKGTHTLEVNKFINMTYYPGFKVSKTEECDLVKNNYGLTKFYKELDWSKKGVVTPIKDQGQCGSCWSFSATGAMESAWAIDMGNLISLSEQELMDCSTDYNDMGCNGGEMTNAFRYAIDNGMCDETEVPYKGQVHSCSGDTCTNRLKFSDCSRLPQASPASMMRYIQYRPLSVAIQADQPVFKFYKSGVITTVECGQSPDHGVLIVGYGRENGYDYWLVKNSWGLDWGDNGYVKIGRNMSNDLGVCGINSAVSFPIV
jgi:C1A family cysteine protease